MPREYYYGEPDKERGSKDVASIEGGANISYVAQDKSKVWKIVLLSFPKDIVDFIRNAAGYALEYCHLKQVVKGH